MIEDWHAFLLPYQQAVNELKVKLRGMRKQYQESAQHSPIEFVTGRVKPVDSIKEKMVRRHVSEDRLEQDMQDIAGLRIMCQFVEDIYAVVDSSLNAWCVSSEMRFCMSPRLTSISPV